MAEEHDWPPATLSDERTLGYAVFAFAEPSLSARMEALDILEAAFELGIEEDAELLDASLMQTLQLSFLAARRWHERPCLARLRVLISKLCSLYEHEACALLAKGLVTQAASFGKGAAAGGHAAYTYLNWSIMILPRLEGKMLTNQLLAAAQFLELIHEDTERRRAPLPPSLPPSCTIRTMQRVGIGLDGVVYRSARTVSAGVTVLACAVQKEVRPRGADGLPPLRRSRACWASSPPLPRATWLRYLMLALLPRCAPLPRPPVWCCRSCHKLASWSLTRRSSRASFAATC